MSEIIDEFVITHLSFHIIFHLDKEDLYIHFSLAHKYFSIDYLNNHMF